MVRDPQRGSLTERISKLEICAEVLDTQFKTFISRFESERDNRKTHNIDLHRKADTLNSELDEAVERIEGKITSMREEMQKMKESLARWGGGITVFNVLMNLAVVIGVAVWKAKT